MRIYDSVFKISERFLKENSPVRINNKQLDNIAELMIKEKPIEFPIKKISMPDIFQEILQEFVGCAINYCYWYGLSTVRPLESSSGKMYSLVEKAFRDYQNGDNFLICTQKLIELLSIERFPLLEKREKHLKELMEDGEDFCISISNAIFHKNKEDFYPFFEDMIKTFPGYASDIFLKRASLFFLQMYRQYGWFKSAMNILPVPADYQIPKMLHYFKCIEYDQYLLDIIKNETLIPKFSKEECSIRSATIIACKKLQEKTGWNISDVDGWFWLQRKEIDFPFHLTVTTDY